VLRALLVWGAGFGRLADAWAGGPEWMRPKPTAEEQRAEATATRWREAGLRAVPEMIEAICRHDQHLDRRAREQIVSLGQRAFPLLIGAASTRRCDLGGVIATLVCRTGAGAAELGGMLGDARPATVLAGLDASSQLAQQRAEHECPLGDPVLARLVPRLRPLLRTSSGEVLEQVLWAARWAGRDAAPLVPELIAQLDHGDVPGNIAASALEAIGPEAKDAVVPLRTLLARGGKWRWRAVAALGAIGPAARPALPDFVPALRAALPQVCSTAPRHSEADQIASAVVRAAGSIGGPGAEPLVPDLVTAFQRLRACGLLGPGSDEHWLAALGALGRYAGKAVPVLMAIARDPDERVVVRRAALDALDRIGTSLGDGGTRQRLRKAMERKREIFERPDPERSGAMQMPPPPPRTPRAFALCRQEASLPPVAEPPEERAESDERAVMSNTSFAQCVRDRLCGPDEETYRATMAKCCGRYRAPLPWFCSAR
jgi:hypothetical protein